MRSQRWYAMSVASICLAMVGWQATGAQDKFPVGTYTLRGWPMVFKSDGAFKIGDDKTLFVEGRYEVKGDQISLTDEGGQSACKGEEKTGVYRWEVKVEALIFHLVKDECEARRTALLEGPLPKAKE